MLEAAVKVEGSWISGCTGVHPYVLGAWRCNGETVAGHKATVKKQSQRIRQHNLQSTLCRPAKPARNKKAYFALS